MTIGSMKPVVRDEYYARKREAGLIGEPHEYSTNLALDMAAIQKYIDSVVAE